MNAARLESIEGIAFTDGFRRSVMVIKLRMALSRDARRRWLGGICLAISASMLILGMTVLKDRLRPQTFLYYWLICMVVTALTLVIALLDFRAVRLRSRQEQVELIDRTLAEIQREKQRRTGEPPPD